MLQHAGLVGHDAKMLEVDLGQLDRPVRECVCLEDRAQPARMLRTCTLEALHVAARHRGPDHITTVGGRATAQGQPLCVVTKETYNLSRDRLWVSPRYKNPTPISEDLACVPVRSRDYSFAGPDRVGQRPRRDLLLLEIWCYVHVGSAEKLGKLVLTHKAIMKDYAGIHSEPVCPILQRKSVGLA